MANQKYLNQAQMGLLVSEAWQDEKLKDKLETDPTQAIKDWAKERLGITLERPMQLPPSPALQVEDLRGGAPSSAASALVCAVACLFYSSGPTTVPTEPPVESSGGSSGEPTVSITVNFCSQGVESTGGSSSGVGWNLTTNKKK